MAANIAPGMNRSFLAENWKNLVPRKHWYHAVDEAQDLIDDKVETDIQGYDIDRRGDQGRERKCKTGWC